jgi:hypothetical protein
MTEASKKQGRIVWPNLITIVSLAILIGTMIVGLGLATGWAIAGALGLGEIGTYVIEAMFVASPPPSSSPSGARRRASSASSSTERRSRQNFFLTNDLIFLRRRPAQIFLRTSTIFSCNRGRKSISAELPNFARACGRVPVGRNPDKRPESCRGRPVAGETGQPRSPRGTRLKATT